MAFLAGQHQPADAIAAAAVVLRQAVVGQKKDVVGQRGDGRVSGTVVQGLVVDLVGAHHQLVLAGDLDDPAQQIGRIKRAGRVVRVDDDDGAGAFGDLGAYVVEIGQPAGALVAQVVARRAAGERHPGRPQRIVRRRDQHLVTDVEQGLHGHHDQLGHAVTEVDVLDLHTLDADALGLVHDRLARREKSLGIAVAGSVGQVVDDVPDDLLGRLETEGREVADVELEDAVAVFLEGLGTRHDRPADVVTDIGQLARFFQRAQRTEGFGFGFHGSTRK